MPRSRKPRAVSRSYARKDGLCRLCEQPFSTVRAGGRTCGACQRRAEADARLPWLLTRTPPLPAGPLTLPDRWLRRLTDPTDDRRS
jgi:hypothetical protein